MILYFHCDSPERIRHYFESHKDDQFIKVEAFSFMDWKNYSYYLDFQKIFKRGYPDQSNCFHE